MQTRNSDKYINMESILTIKMNIEPGSDLTLESVCKVVVEHICAGKVSGSLSIECDSQPIATVKYSLTN